MLSNHMYVSLQGLLDINQSTNPHILHPHAKPTPPTSYFLFPSSGGGCTSSFKNAARSSRSASAVACVSRESCSPTGGLIGWIVVDVVNVGLLRIMQMDFEDRIPGIDLHASKLMSNESHAKGFSIDRPMPIFFFKFKVNLSDALSSNMKIRHHTTHTNLESRSMPVCLIEKGVGKEVCDEKKQLLTPQKESLACIELAHQDQELYAEEAALDARLVQEGCGKDKQPGSDILLWLWCDRTVRVSKIRSKASIPKPLS